MQTLFDSARVDQIPSFATGLIDPEPEPYDPYPVLRALTGAGLFRAIREAEQQHEARFLATVQRWGFTQELPGRILSWPTDAIREGYSVLCDAIDQLNRDLDAGALAFAAQAACDRGVVLC